MKTLLVSILVILYFGFTEAQTTVQMEEVGGVYTMPCKVNGLTLKFIFDTGASDISISLTEALFMLKNGYLKEDDIRGTQRYQLASGDIEEGTKIILRTVKIGDRELHNVEASILHNLNAPLLLGQSALRKLGRIEFDYSRNTLIMYGGTSDGVAIESKMDENQSVKGYTSPIRYAEGSDLKDPGKYMYVTQFDNPRFEVPLLKRADVNCREVLYKCPKDAQVYVLERIEPNFFKVKVDGHIGYIAECNTPIISDH